MAVHLACFYMIPQEFSLSTTQSQVVTEETEVMVAMEKLVEAEAMADKEELYVQARLEPEEMEVTAVTEEMVDMVVEELAEYHIPSTGLSQQYPSLGTHCPTDSAEPVAVH